MQPYTYGSNYNGLEEFTRVRGQIAQSGEHLASGQDVLVGEASSSIPNISAYEMLCAVNHIKETTGKVRTYIFPATSLRNAVSSTDLHPVFKAEASTSRELVLDQAAYENGAVKLGANPVSRLTNIVSRSLERSVKQHGPEKMVALANELGIDTGKDVPSKLGQMAYTDHRILELLSPEDREKINTYLLKLPTTLFKTQDDLSFVEHVVRSRARAVFELGDLLLEGEHHRKLSNFSVESIVPHLGEMTLAQISQLLGPSYATKVALTYDCPECGINTPDSVCHYIAFDGSAHQTNGQLKRGSEKSSLNGCKSLGVKVKNGEFTAQQVLEMPVKDLLNAGFMLSGTGIYAGLKHTFDDGNLVLGVANYNPARGTVEKIAQMWQGPMYITSRARIYRDGKIATYRELNDYLTSAPHATAKFMDWVKSIPVIATGPEFKFEI